MRTAVPFSELASADLYVDRTYEGGIVGNVSDDPLQRLLPVGNQGGFRYKGSPRAGVRLVVLYTSGEDAEWPDSLDPFTGTFTYFGDNKAPGRDLHDTQRRGNLILQQVFELAHGDAASRSAVPPILVFSKGGRGRDVVFRGLAIPGSPTVPPGDDLVACGERAAVGASRTTGRSSRSSMRRQSSGIGSTMRSREMPPCQLLAQRLGGGGRPKVSSTR